MAKIYCMGPVFARSVVVSAATNATPIVLTLASQLGGSGANALNAAVDTLTISGATGNTAANGFYAPGTYVVNSPTSITLTGKAGNGAYNASSGTASAPQSLVLAPTFPTVQGVSDVSKLQVARMLFAPLSSGTGTIFVGMPGMSQANLANVFRVINPPPTTGIMDFYDLEIDGTNVINLAEYAIDCAKPSTEAVLVTFWLK